MRSQKREFAILPSWCPVLPLLLLLVVFRVPTAHGTPIFLDRFEKKALPDSAVALMRSGKYEEARSELMKRLEQKPECHATLVMLGYVEAELNHWDQALASMKQAIVLAPEAQRDDLRVDLANIQAAKGDQAEALDLFDELLARHPSHARALFYSATILREAGKNEAAIANFQRLLVLDPNHGKALLALIQVHLQEGRTEEAIALSRRLQTANPQSDQGYYWEAVAHLRKPEAKPDTAIKLLNRALEKNPANDSTVLLLSMLSLKGGNVEEARRMIHNRSQSRQGPQKPGASH